MKSIFLANILLMVVLAAVIYLIVREHTTKMTITTDAAGVMTGVTKFTGITKKAA